MKIWDFVIITLHCIQDYFVNCIEESTTCCPLLRLSDPTKPILGN